MYKVTHTPEGTQAVEIDLEHEVDMFDLCVTLSGGEPVLLVEELEDLVNFKIDPTNIQVL